MVSHSRFGGHPVGPVCLLQWAWAPWPAPERKRREERKRERKKGERERENRQDCRMLSTSCDVLQLRGRCPRKSRSTCCKAEKKLPISDSCEQRAVLLIYNNTNPVPTKIHHRQWTGKSYVCVPLSGRSMRGSLYSAPICCMPLLKPASPSATSVARWPPKPYGNCCIGPGCTWCLHLSPLEISEVADALH
jgi:hypothetical protein